MDVYRSNSHGSDASSSPDFLADLNPTVVIISNGNSVRHQHPRRETLRRYEALGAPPTVFQTNKYLAGGVGGNVADALIADVRSRDTNGTILVTVNAAMRHYTVSLGQGRSYRFDRKRAQEPEILSEVKIESRPPAGDREASRKPTTGFLYFGIFLMACAGAGAVGYFWVKGRQDQESGRYRGLASDRSGPSLSPARVSGGPVPAAAAENRGTLQPGGDSPPRKRLRWERFPDSDIPEQLPAGGRYIWVRRQPGRLTSRQGSVNVEFAEDLDFLTNVPVTIEHELCLSVAERPATEKDSEEAGEQTVVVYNRGTALLTALGNCSDAEKAVLLKAEIDSWLDELESAVSDRFPGATISLVRSVEGTNLRQTTEKILGQLLKLIQGRPPGSEHAGHIDLPQSRRLAQTRRPGFQRQLHRLRARASPGCRRPCGLHTPVPDLKPPPSQWKGSPWKGTSMISSCQVWASLPLNGAVRAPSTPEFIYSNPDDRFLSAKGAS